MTINLSIIPDAALQMCQSTGEVANLESLYSRDSYFAEKLDALIARAEAGDLDEVIRLQMIVMTGGRAASMMIDFKAKGKARVAKDPWAVSWRDCASAALCEALEKAAVAAIPTILQSMALPKGQDGALPNSGLPAEVLQHLADYQSALEEDEQSGTEATATVLKTHTDALLCDVLHSFKGHTKFKSGSLKIPAVTYSGATINGRETDGTPNLANVSFGWRADANRKPTKKATVAVDEAEAPSEE